MTNYVPELCPVCGIEVGEAQGVAWCDNCGWHEPFIDDDDVDDVDLAKATVFAADGQQRPTPQLAAEIVKRAVRTQPPEFPPRIASRYSIKDPRSQTVTIPHVVVPRDLLELLVRTEDCWFDRHGGCQAHGYLSLEPGEVCPQEQAKQLLQRRLRGGVMDEQELSEIRALRDADTLHLLPKEALIASIKHLAGIVLELELHIEGRDDA